MPLDTFLEAAWRDHADHPDDVADRLAGALHLIREPSDFAPFVRLATHVFGEHLGEWQRGAGLIESLRQLPAFDGSPAAAGSLARGGAALRLAGGDESALVGLSADDRVYALAAAADAFTGRDRIADAMATFARALDGMTTDPAADHPASRALAVCGNNLSVALERKGDLSAAEAASMLAAARASLKFWKLTGTWLEEERAEYQLARSLLRAGELPAARASIERCILICAQNGAPPFEHFFGHAVRALVDKASGDAAAFAANRATARGYYARIPEDDRQWCERELRELER